MSLKAKRARGGDNEIPKIAIFASEAVLYFSLLILARARAAAKHSAKRKGDEGRRRGRRRPAPCQSPIHSVHVTVCIVRRR